jgi:hypothetical protein
MIFQAGRQAILIGAAWLAFCNPLSAADRNKLSDEEIRAGWISLFDGETLFGWQAGSDANWKAADGVISVSEGAPGLLYTTSEFGNYILKVDFRYDKETNSGVFLRTPLTPKDPKSDCYELNLAEESVSPFPTGSFVGRQKGTAPPAAGDWHSYEIAAEGPRFRVKLDGKQVLDYTDAQPLGRGFIGLQLNKGRAEFRDIKLKPLSLESLFNGRDLTGWKPFAGKPSVYSVTADGNLNVKNGPGQLETERRFGDFVLQLEVFSNGAHLNSGIFFRSIPGEFQQGYESQIQNGYKEGDRTKPMDCGTGGFYRRQNARKVVADDFAWFGMTLLASDKHMATWVNGYQVSDWTDPRPANDNPRQGSRLEPGTLIIQGHDPTTDLSFRNLRAAEVPKR